MGRKTWNIAGLCMMILLASNARPAEQEKPKWVLKDNYTVEYLILPSPAENFRTAFTRGIFYGRLRSNLFYWNWEREDPSQKQKDHQAYGLGGSMIFKTAPLHGVSATAGLYTSQNPFAALNVEKDEVGFVKSGKDTFSRNKIKNGGLYNGHWGITSLAQAYLEYENFGFDVKFGRQIYESFLTKSNDSKMIPNTFEGITVNNKSLQVTTISAAYLTRQKLRDHEDFHDVIAVDSWDENDDSGAHLGLTKSRLAARDIDPALIIVGLANQSIKGLKLETWATVVTELFWSAMVEANYQISFGDGWSLTPGVRYMQQFDKGAGEIGGAAISGALAGQVGKNKGYEDAGSVDGSLMAARLALKKGPGKLSIGYSRVADDADLIAPWRGFPTSGYTREMAQLDWLANTDSWMIKFEYDFNKADILRGFKASLAYADMNYDEVKEQLGGIKKTDSNIVHLNMRQKIPWVEGLDAILRLGRYSADNRSNGQDPSYQEGRFELNYLF
jgi:hypothetical protein